MFWGELFKTELFVEFLLLSTESLGQEVNRTFSSCIPCIIVFVNELAGV